MKKISLSTLALATSFALFAQGDPVIGTPNRDHKPLRTEMEVKTRFGIKAGVNMAKFNVHEDTYANPSLAPEGSYKTSFNAGAFVNIPIGGNFRLQPELLWSGQGSKISEKTSQSTGTTTFRYEEDLHYVTLPIMLQLQSPSGFYLELGPRLGYLIDAKSKGQTPISTTEETDRDYYYDNFDIGWSGGVGYTTRIGLGVGARYNYGFRNIVKENSSGNSPGDVENRVISFGLSYMFGAYK
jgi:hypothetical protein